MKHSDRKLPHLLPACATEVNLLNSTTLLLPDHVISSTEGAIPQFVVDFACLPFRPPPYPHVILNFSHPVILTRARSFYPIQLDNGFQTLITYVNKYTIEASGDGENFTLYSDASGRTVQPVVTDMPPPSNSLYTACVTTGDTCWHCQHILGAFSNRPVLASHYNRCYDWL